jgi:hypothetical protein
MTFHMKFTKCYTIIGLCLGTVALTGLVSAESEANLNKFGQKCMTYVAGFKTGLPSYTRTKQENPAQYLQTLSSEYTSLVEAVSKSQACFQSMLQLTLASRRASGGNLVSPRLAGLRKGSAEVGRIFKVSHTQFEGFVDMYATDILAGVMPAAGGDSVIDADGSTLKGVDTLQSSLALLSLAADVAQRQNTLKKSSRKAH